jgi:hypothetical protein
MACRFFIEEDKMSGIKPDCYSREYRLKPTDIQTISRRLSINTMIIFYGWFVTMIHGHSKRVFRLNYDYSHYVLTEAFDCGNHPGHKSNIEDDIDIFFEIV